MGKNLQYQHAVHQVIARQLDLIMAKIMVNNRHAIGHIFGVLTFTEQRLRNKFQTKTIKLIGRRFQCIDAIDHHPPGNIHKAQIAVTTAIPPLRRATIAPDV